jgi:hypothetical protein
MNFQELREALRKRVEDFKTGKLKGDEMPIGIKKRRNANANWSVTKDPGFNCPNCNCNRYTKCRCQAKKVVAAEQE